MGEVLLGDVLETAGEESLIVWAAPHGLDVRLREVILYDATETLPAGPDGLLLAIGVAPQAAAVLLKEAAARGVAAMVVRARPADRDRLASQAEESGIGLLALGPDMSWAEVTGRLRGALDTLLSLDERPEFHRGDLVSFANALSDAAGGSVVIFSPRQEVLAASRLRADDDPVRRQAVLDQEGPGWLRARLRRRGFYRRLWEGDGVVAVDPVPDLGMRRRLAIAIRGGDEILGSIWVAEGAEPLPADAAATLRRAARAAGVHLLRQRGLTRASRPGEGYVRQLLAGEADPAMVAGRLDVDPHASSAVLSFAIAQESAGQEYRLAELLALHLAAFRCTAVPVSSAGRVDVLICGLTDEAALHRLARDMTTRASQAMEVSLLVAAGPVVGGLGSARRSLTEADLALRVLRNRGTSDTCVVTNREVQGSIGLLRLVDHVAARAELRCGAVYALIEHDRDHGTAYGLTLAAYLDAFGDVIVAARRLRVHPNTLRYRLRRAAELSGLDLTDTDERIMAAIQLRAEGLSKPTDQV